MRREFILVLLGIICVSTMSSLLTGFVVQVDSDKLLLDTVVGVVGAGNFSYWQLGHSGPLIIELTSITGDADLYIADNIRPSYEIDKNNFSSATCGADVVSIPAEFPRPLGIGVFGYWHHAVSEYSIQVFLDTSGPVVLNAESHHGNDMTDTDRRVKEKHVSRKTEDDSNKPRFVRFLNILDMIFEMFVL